MKHNEMTTAKSIKAFEDWRRAGCPTDCFTPPDSPTPQQWKEIRRKERIAQNGGNGPRRQVNNTVYSFLGRVSVCGN